MAQRHTGNTERDQALTAHLFHFGNDAWCHRAAVELQCLIQLVVQLLHEGEVQFLPAGLAVRMNFHIWQFNKIRCPICLPKIIGLLVQGHKNDPQFIEAAVLGKAL